MYLQIVGQIENPLSVQKLIKRERVISIHELAEMTVSDTIQLVISAIHQTKTGHFEQLKSHMDTDSPN